MSFGHCHQATEEVYVVLTGSARMKLDDDIIDVVERDILYVEPTTTREWEAGPQGLEMIAFGAHAEGDGEIKPGWWAD